MKNVDNHLQIIEHDPLACGKPVQSPRPDGMVSLKRVSISFAIAFSCGSDVAEQITEKIRERRDRAEVKDDDVFRLFV